MSDTQLRDLLINEYGLTFQQAGQLVASDGWKLIVQMLVHRRGIFYERIEQEKDPRNITLLQGKLHENRMLLDLSDMLLQNNRSGE